MTQEILGKDIQMKNADISFSDNQDFSHIKFRRNLAQAIEHRLKTIKGEFYNPEYGSEVHKCIGKSKDDLLVSQLKGYIVECLKQEPRIQSINSINITFDEFQNDRVNVDINIIPIDENTEFNLIFPLFI